MNDGGPAPKKRNWLAIVLGALLLFGMLGVGCIVVAVSFFRQNLDVTATNEQTAMQQMDAVRSKFPGQQPLIQFVDGEPKVMAGAAAEGAAPSSLSTLHVMAYDVDEGNLVNFSLPFWLVRMKSGPFRISAYQQGWDDRGISFRVEDLEKRGPGIIVDLTQGGGGRVVVWAE
jgi:hypothetical protein